MATGNFYYENRCIVVTNEDYDMGNYPAIDRDDRSISDNRNYPASVIKTDKHFKYFRPVIASGYYEHACIDYYKVDDSEIVRYYVGEPYYFNSVREFVEEFMLRAKDYGFPITKYRLLKLIGKKGEQDLEEFIFDAYAKIDEYFADLEEIEINKYLDELKAEYGYQEYVCTARFSNGEAIYSPVENPLNLRKPVKRKKAC